LQVERTDWQGADNIGHDISPVQPYKPPMTHLGTATPSRVGAVSPTYGNETKDTRAERLILHYYFTYEDGD